MRKLWRVALYEYRRHVFKKSFILALLSLPFFIGLTIFAGWLSDSLTRDNAAVGYVDQAGLLADPLLPPRPAGSPDNPTVPELVPLVRFETRDEAQVALDEGELQAYYVIAPDYPATRRVDLVYYEPPDGAIMRQFWDFMQINSLTDLEAEVAERAVSGSNLIVRWPEDTPGGSREFSQDTFFNSFLPLIVGAAFMILMLMSSGYLMGTVVEEKENRTVEILATSLSSGKLMGGKILGVVGVSLTQLLGWIAFAALALFVGGEILGLAALQGLRLHWPVILPVLAVFGPAYVLLAALLVAVGATVTESQEAQQVTALFMFPLWIPMWFAQSLIEHPNSPLSVGLSLFPLTSLASFILRSMFSTVPLWQTAVSVAILSTCALGAIWLAGRAFRLGMLRYGQRLDWRELIRT